MRQFRSFLRILGQTLASPPAVAAFLQRPFRFSLTFFLGYAILRECVVWLIIALVGIGPFRAVLAALPTLADHYPADLVVEIKDGTLSTNSKEPVVLPLPAGVVPPTENNRSTKPPANLVVLDPTARSEDIDRFDTFILLTRTEVVSRNTLGKIQSTPLEKIRSVRITRADVQQTAATVGHGLRVAVPFLVVLLLPVLIVGYASVNLVFLLLVAFPLWAIAAAMKRPLQYGKAVQCGLHLVVIPATYFDGLQFALRMFAPGLRPPFVPTALILLAGILVLRHVAPVPPAAPRSPARPIGHPQQERSGTPSAPAYRQAGP